MAEPATPTENSSWPLRRPPCYKIVCYCIQVLMAISILFFFALFIILPATMIPDVRVDPGSSLYSFNVAPSKVNLNWNILISIKNPNEHFVVKYKNIKATVHYGDMLFSRVSIPPFIQETRNQTVLHVPFNLTLPTTTDSWLARCLESDFARGWTSINVDLQASRRFRIGGLNLWIIGFDVYFSCTDLIFTFSSHEANNITVINDASNICMMGFFGYV